MTIAVTVKNQDSRPTAVIEVIALDARSGFQAQGGTKQKLGAGEEQTFYVHSTQSLEIKEISQ